MNITSSCVVALTWKLTDTLGESLDELEDPVEFLVGGDDLLVSLAALCAVVGATRSVWVGFKGGRGIATGVGTALAIAPLAVAAAAPFFFLSIWRTRIVSIGSLAAAFAFAPASLIIRATSGVSIDIGFAAYAIVGPALVWIACAVICRLSGRQR